MIVELWNTFIYVYIIYFGGEASIISQSLASAHLATRW